MKATTAIAAQLAGVQDAFQKSAPADAATNVTTDPTLLKWTASSSATSYEYCIDTRDNNTCDTLWKDNQSDTTASLSGLLRDTTYYWQVRARGPGGTSDADNGHWWHFDTLPAAPGAFNLLAPEDGAVNVPINPTLIWTGSPGASTYAYCLQTAARSICPNGWVEVGNHTRTTLTGLAGQTTYFWMVQARNAGGITQANAGAWKRFITCTPTEIIVERLYLPVLLTQLVR